MIPLLEDKRILLGVTGGISVYKVCALASHLTQAGAQVDVVMTEAATRFVTPLTFEALTGRVAYTDMWRTSGPALPPRVLVAVGGAEGEGLPTHIAHVGLAHAAGLLVIAPATANTLAKLAAGLADNLLTTLALAASCPVLAVPAMDAGMWSHPATQANVAALRDRGVYFAGPVCGRMASGLEGEGRMMEPDEILGHIRRVLGREGSLVGQRVVVTAGPTREPLDPVRFLSNPSSGRQGLALAQAALDRGASTTLIAGPIALPTPAGAERVDVTTAQEMHDAVVSAVEGADVLLMAAAVADYRPPAATSQKIKKGEDDLTLRLVRTPDILSAVAKRRAETGFPRVVAGFAAESEDLVENGRAKLAAKNLDLIVANDITARDAGFAVETNRVVLIGRDGSVEELPLMPKSAVAEAILDRLLSLLSNQPTNPFTSL
ncbi:MAG: bifunctional phosphopantothenoylcysteine decarboxylase/phosphopantothenate--cysteine ligase CoaBC [Anaerolineae bacterium]|nr:bifunctional phosphopantothenoylcysteine decarboxylase/phosphopantothenate--cysteine ligase CoaBC [Anaerolineae bacterium]